MRWILIANILLHAESLLINEICKEDNIQELQKDDDCQIPEFFTCQDFADKYWNKAPAILRWPKRVSEPFDSFQRQTNRSTLLSSQLHIRLSTSVSYTGKVFTDATVGEYLKDESPASKFGNETYYLFGNHQGDAWNEFLAAYPRLETSKWFSCLHLDPKGSSLSFGCAKQGTGVPWHFQ